MSKTFFFICLSLLLGCVQFLGLLLALLPKLLLFQKIKAATEIKKKIGKNSYLDEKVIYISLCLPR